jgi:hypothetical protein
MNQPTISRVTWPYFNKVLAYHGMTFEFAHDHPSIWGGDQLRFPGYNDYNFLSDINSCFSNRPSGLLRDRTGTVKMPFLTESAAPWSVPTNNPDLEHCFCSRVKEIEARHRTVNLLWSGGIDSTAMVVAWLKYTSGNNQVRIFYSIDSIKENVGFFLHLQDQKRFELVEIGGNVFYQNNFDGAEVSGGSGDDVTASLDESFYNAHGWRQLQSSWKDFFWRIKPNDDFIDFCERWFAQSGRDITTVLHARWWFYLNKMPPANRNRIAVKTDLMSETFFLDPGFLAHFYHQTESLIPKPSWTSYKISFKKFIFDYFPDQYYFNNKSKENSGGYTIFCNKAALLQKKEEICMLGDGTAIRTNNLPFLSCQEYRQLYSNTLDYLFNQ